MNMKFLILYKNWLAVVLSVLIFIFGIYPEWQRHSEQAILQESISMQSVRFKKLNKIWTTKETQWTLLNDKYQSLHTQPDSWENITQTLYQFAQKNHITMGRVDYDEGVMESKGYIQLDVPISGTETNIRQFIDQLQQKKYWILSEWNLRVLQDAWSAQLKLKVLPWRDSNE